MRISLVFFQRTVSLFMSLFNRSRIITIAALFVVGALAQDFDKPVQHSIIDLIPTVKDHQFSGVININVDASKIEQKIFTIKENIPTQGLHKLTLLYPKWENASHGPSINVSDVAGLKITYKNEIVNWKRDRYEPHAFHVDILPHMESINVEFQVFGDSSILSDNYISIPWNRLILYPAGWYTRNINVLANLTLPTGFTSYSSLELKKVKSTKLSYALTSLETLIESPVLSGRLTKKHRIPSQDAVELNINIITDNIDDLDPPSGIFDGMNAMMHQVKMVFGDTPFNQYNFLVRMEDGGWVGGLEHRTSSEIYLPSGFFRKPLDKSASIDIFAHELIHSWNGFYRTPADHWAANPNTPRSGSLLWVYEGQTEFWGKVISTRSGLLTSQEFRDKLAIDASEVESRLGRAWRPLSDVVNHGTFMLKKRVPWRDWQRSKDYYSEGVMLWLNVDAEIRAITKNKKSIDDFAKLFFGGATPNTPTKTYTIDEICNTLNLVAAKDWMTFFNGWLEGSSELNTNIGLEMHGWRLVYTEDKSEVFRQLEELDGTSDLTYSIGIKVSEAGVVKAVTWESPVFNAGVTIGSRILEVNGEAFDIRQITKAIHNSVSHPITLVILQDGKKKSLQLEYNLGLRYPHLERISNSADTLTKLSEAL